MKRKKNEKYPTVAVIFHELLHSALNLSFVTDDYKRRKILEGFFQVRDIDNPYRTTIDNVSSDEGVVEDCEYKLFPDTSRPYLNKMHSWNRNRSRRYNTEDDDCILCKLCMEKKSDDCNDPPKGGGKNSGGNFGPKGPGGDHADDNFSSSSGIVQEYNLAPEAVIFTNGFYEEALKLYGGLEFDGDNVAQRILDVTPYLVLPTGSLFGKEYDSVFKNVLEEYVRLGGTLFVTGQQYGSHFDNILPIQQGEALKTYG